MNVAVVASRYGDQWQEDQLLARRLAGALACTADVDILVPGTGPSEVQFEGAARVISFPATSPDPARLRAWQLAVFGEAPDNLVVPSPLLARRREAVDLPSVVEQELVAAEGGASPAMCEHLHKTPYELVVFVGHHNPTTTKGVEALPDNRRFVVAPATRHEALLGLPAHAETFARAERVLVCTESEREMVTRAVGGRSGPVENIGFVVGINTLGRNTEPPGYDHHRYILVAMDWNRHAKVDRLLRWAEYLERDIDPDFRLRLVGPGAERRPLGLPRTQSRLDMWRWISRAFAVLDPSPRRLIGREVLEAFLYGTPVLVNDEGGATKEHADVGNGGLWFRSDEELYGLAEVLLDKEVRGALGVQGQVYAETNYTDLDSFVKRITSLLLP